MLSKGLDVIQMDFSVVLVDEGRLDVTTKEVISASVATVESEFSLGKWSDKARIESAIGRYSIKQSVYCT